MTNTTMVSKAFVKDLHSQLCPSTHQTMMRKYVVDGTMNYISSRDLGRETNLRSMALEHRGLDIIFLRVMSLYLMVQRPRMMKKSS
jgi:hypothetical protein